MNRYIIFGASRGLGKEISKAIINGTALLISRKSEQLKIVNDEMSVESNFESFDFTKKSSFDELMEIVKNYDPTHIYYIAGGGPHGKFASKKFKDHMWAYNLNLLFPAQLIHWSLNNIKLKQFVLVGSSVAECKPDPLASSYSSAKHGLKGLITSINSEGCEVDLRLFSPPYMDTDLLPRNSKPHRDDKVKSPEEIAQLFHKWANDADGLKHYFIEVE